LPATESAPKMSLHRASSLAQEVRQDFNFCLIRYKNTRAVKKVALDTLRSLVILFKKTVSEGNLGDREVICI